MEELKMSMENGRPTKPSDINLPKFMRFADPDDPTKVIELAVVDTGAVTPDGFKIMALGTAAVATSSSDGPNAKTANAFPCTGGTDAIPVTIDARYVWLQNDPGNANDIRIFGFMKLGPGEQMVIPTDIDAPWITFVGVAFDVLNYAILRRV
jgi:hypothetical protein